MKLKFAFSERKALEAMAFVAKEHPGFTPLFVAKIFFFAEKWHLNRYGRPIVADTYIAMPKGPVPSTIKNYIDARWDWVERPEGIDDVFFMDRSGQLPHLMPGKRGSNFESLSESDKECLREAISFCEGKSAEELSWITHREKSWVEAEQNAPMDYFNFIDDDNPHHDEIVDTAIENAFCGVL